MVTTDPLDPGTGALDDGPGTTGTEALDDEPGIGVLEPGTATELELEAELEQESADNLISWHPVTSELSVV